MPPSWITSIFLFWDRIEVTGTDAVMTVRRPSGRISRARKVMVVPDAMMIESPDEIRLDRPFLDHVLLLLFVDVAVVDIGAYQNRPSVSTIEFFLLLEVGQILTDRNLRNFKLFGERRHRDRPVLLQEHQYHIVPLANTQQGIVSVFIHCVSCLISKRKIRKIISQKQNSAEKSPLHRFAGRQGRVGRQGPADGRTASRQSPAGGRTDTDRRAAGKADGPTGGLTAGSGCPSHGCPLWAEPPAAPGPNRSRTGMRRRPYGSAV